MKSTNAKQKFNKIILPFRQLFFKFIDARTQVKNKITFSHSNIYIFPNKYGFVLLWITLAMAGVGINYSNSMILGLAYLLISFFLVVIFHTYRNLIGLTLEASHSQNGFSGETLLFEINISRKRKRSYESIRIVWEDIINTVSLLEHREISLNVLMPVSRRGHFKPGRLKVETTYPVGLLVCWSYARFDVEGWAYPKPIKNRAIVAMNSVNGKANEQLIGGSNDFHGLYRYVVGDSLKQIDWKAYAREGHLYTKRFTDPVDEHVWIDWQDYAGVDEELRYGYMCYWVLKMSEHNSVFGVRLPQQVINLGNGESHKISCLLALAKA